MISKCGKPLGDPRGLRIIGEKLGNIGMLVPAAIRNNLVGQIGDNIVIDQPLGLEVHALGSLTR